MKVHVNCLLCVKNLLSRKCQNFDILIEVNKKLNHLTGLWKFGNLKAFFFCCIARQKCFKNMWIIFSSDVRFTSPRVMTFFHRLCRHIYKCNSRIFRKYMRNLHSWQIINYYRSQKVGKVPFKRWWLKNVIETRNNFLYEFKWINKSHKAA